MIRNSNSIKLGITSVDMGLIIATGKRVSLKSRAFVKEALTLDGNVEVRRIQVTDKLIGVSVKDADTRGQYKLNIIAIEHDHRTDVDFSAQYCFSKDYIISVIEKIENIDRIESDIHGE